MDAKQIGEVIKEARKRKKIKQKQLAADVLHINVFTMSHAARDCRRFTITLRRTTTRIAARAVKSRCAMSFITAHGAGPGRQERNNANKQ